MAEIRAMVAAPLGPAHMLLSQYWQVEKASNKALMSHVGGLGMVHDAQMWVAGQEILMQMMRKKYDFGDLLNATWYPYWEKNPYLEIDKPSVICSFYERDGDLFIIVLNVTGEKQAVNIRFADAYTKKYPGTKSVRVYDPAEQREEENRTPEGKIALTLEPYLPKLLTLKK